MKIGPIAIWNRHSPILLKETYFACRKYDICKIGYRLSMSLICDVVINVTYL